MDTAEHMFAKCKQLASTLNPSAAENLVDLLYEIGKGSMERRHFELAVRWLERAHEILEDQELEMLSFEAGQLRLSVMQTLGKSTLYKLLP
jgi:hypothetical protein